MSGAPTLEVSVLYASAARTVHEITLVLPAGSTARDAVEASGWLAQFPEMAGQALGVWGRLVTPQMLLRDGDRLEIYRALRVDPKVARRERFVGQGARGAGLFDRRRPHSKAGY